MIDVSEQPDYDQTKKPAIQPALLIKIYLYEESPMCNKYREMMVTDHISHKTFMK